MIDEFDMTDEQRKKLDREKNGICPSAIRQAR